MAKERNRKPRKERKPAGIEKCPTGIRDYGKPRVLVAATGNVLVGLELRPKEYKAL